MNPDIPLEAVEFGATVRRAFNDAGGITLAREAEIDPHVGRARAAAILLNLGVSEIGFSAPDIKAAMAAAQLCREVGRVAWPYPVAGVVVGGSGRPPMSLVDPEHPKIDHGDLFSDWLAVDLLGKVFSVQPEDAPQRGKLGPFITAVKTEELATQAPALTSWLLALGAAQLLGASEAAHELAVEHVRVRRQFNKPLAAFQTVQFRVAEVTVALLGLEELIKWTVWRLTAAPGSGRADALALRLHAADVAANTFRAAHQLHGAVGFCDEHDLSVLTRHTQPLLRVAGSHSALLRELAFAVREEGFDALFPIQPINMPRESALT